MATIGQDLLKLKVKKDHETKLKASYEKAKIDREQWERKCFERMEAEESESIRTRGVLFSPVSKVYAQIQDRDAFVKWANENDPDLIQEKERSGELNAAVRQRQDDGEPLPPGVGFYTREYISVRKS